MNAMILAAGLGTRLRPFSRIRPKPLFPVFDRPLLRWTVDRLRATAVGTIVINTHHLADQFPPCLNADQRIVVQYEPEILGTGGSIRRAMSMLGNAPLLVTNGDIVHDFDFRRLVEHHLAGEAAVTLLVHHCPRFNTVQVAADGRVVGFGSSSVGNGACRLLAFTGIQMISPGVFTGMAGGYQESIPWYQSLIANGVVIQAVEASDLLWTDMGTVDQYLALHGRGMEDGRWRKVLGVTGAGRHFQGDGAQVDPDARLMDWTVVGRHSIIGPGARLERVVVWDGVRVPAGVAAQDTILCHDRHGNLVGGVGR